MQVKGLIHFYSNRDDTNVHINQMLLQWVWGWSNILHFKPAPRDALDHS
jgi:hypothetical protein